MFPVKRQISLFLVLTMIAALLGGCGSAPTSVAEVPSDAAEAAESQVQSSTESVQDAAEPGPEALAPEAVAGDEAEPAEEPESEPESFDPMETLYTYELPIYEEPVELTYYFSFPSFFLNFCDPQEDSVYFNTISERTGIHTQLILNTGEAAAEEFALMMATNDLPDLIFGFTSLYTAGVDSAVDEGIIIDIGDYMEYAPCYSYWTGDDDIRRSITSSDGHIGGFYTLYDQGIYNNGLVIRTDWLEDLGLDKPVTIDDITATLKAFQSEKGADSAMWFGFTGLHPALSGAYGIDASYDVSSYQTSYPFYVVDGKVHFSIVEDGFRDYIATLNGWFEDGLVDKDFFTQAAITTSSEAVEAHVVGGHTGIWLGGVEDSVAYPSAAEEYGIEIAALPDPVLHEGDVNHVGQNTSRVLGNCVSINAEGSNVIAAVQWMDYQYSEEGSELNNWGLEGVGFEYDENGRKVSTDAVTNGVGDMLAVVVNALYRGGFQPSVKTLEATQAGYGEGQIEMMRVWAGSADGAYLYPKGASLTSEETEVFSGIIFDINTYVQENVPKFIAGEKPMEEFDAFVQTVEGMGVEEIVQIKQDSYDRYMD